MGVVLSWTWPGISLFCPSAGTREARSQRSAMRRQGGRKVSEKALLTSTKPCPESVVRDLFVRYTWARLGGVSSKAGEAAAGPAKAAAKPPSPRKAGTHPHIRSIPQEALAPASPARSA